MKKKKNKWQTEENTDETTEVLMSHFLLISFILKHLYLSYLLYMHGHRGE